MINDKIKKKILIISNAKADSGRLAERLYDNFLKYDYDVDYLTLYPIDRRPDIKHIYSKDNKWIRYTTDIVWKLIYKIRKPLTKFGFFNYSDRQLPVKFSHIRHATNNKIYDVVITYFWQHFLTPITIKQIYQYYKCKIIFCMTDFGALAGGCHYYCDCDRYKEGCGKCPAWRSHNKNDITHKNSLIRKKIYNEIKPIITGNSYMQDVYLKSFLLNNCTYMKTYGTVNLNLFTKKDRLKLKAKYEIPVQKSTILFFGCQSLTDEKKGMRILLDALNDLSNQIEEKEKENILLLIAGKDITPIMPYLPFDYKYLGLVQYDKLPEVYSLSTCFLSPSISDAGPSMVNQSLACGTPVVAFDIGIAQDCVITEQTGYRAKIGDSIDFAKGIKYICCLNEEEYKQMSDNCRSLAEEYFSINSSIERFKKFF